MRISNGFVIRIHKTENWWLYNYFFSPFSNLFAKRAVYGFTDRVFNQIKRK